MVKLLIQIIGITCLILATTACGDTSSACSTENDCAGTEECIWVRDGNQVVGRMCSIRCQTDQECPPGLACAGAASSCPTCNDFIQICQ